MSKCFWSGCKEAGVCHSVDGTWCERHWRKFSALERVEKVEVLRRSRTVDEVIEKEIVMATKKGTDEVRRAVGKTWKLTVKDTKIQSLVENEKAPKNKKLTDDQIAAFWKKEFPDGAPGELHTVSAVRRARNHYNKGGWHGGTSPSPRSKSYDGDGNVLEVTRGRPVEATKEAKKTGTKKSTKRKSRSRSRSRKTAA